MDKMTETEEMEGMEAAAAPAGMSDEHWSAEVHDGKITKLSFHGVSWI